MRFERLGNKITQIRGISYKPSDISAIPLPDFVPVLKSNNIQENGLDTSDLIYIHKNKVKPEQFIKKGDLLLAASSGSKEIVGKNIYFESDFEGSFGAFCKLVRPLRNINSRYLATFFKSVIYKRHIRKLLSGALINNLKNEYIDSLLIPDLPDSYQLHIANLLSKAENLIAQRKESIRLLDEFLKSTFLEMFGDPFSNPKDWNKRTLNEICANKGQYGSGASAIEYSPEKPRYVRITDIREDGTLNSELKSPSTAHCEWADYKLNHGDILFARSGATVGKSFMYLASYGNCIYAGYLIRYVPQREIMLPEFLFHFTKTDYYKNWISENQSIMAQPNINANQYGNNLYIISPPVELQTQFAEIVNKTEALKTKYQQSLQELENLYGSLSQKAFKGELTIKENS